MAWTREAAIDALRQWSVENDGRAPTANAWETVPTGCPSRPTLVRLFGSWPDALAAAGFPRRGRGDYDRAPYRKANR